MKRTSALAALACAAALAHGAALAQQAATPDRRADIAAQRQEIESRFAADDRACRQRFAVTGCLDDARRRRREALAPLRQDELRIDTEERKQRAATRLADIEAKQRADAARDAASAPQPARPAAEPREPPRPARRIGGGSPPATLGAEERARREADAEAKYAQRQRDAARHRAAVDARNAERAAKGKVVKPLPVAPGASAL